MSVSEVAANADPLIYLIAGELSGDALGGALMKSLKSRCNDRIRFAGIGGPAMAAEGLESAFPMEELSLFDLHEILLKLPSLLGRISQTEAAIRRLRPSAIVTIDCPRFSLRVSRRVRDLGAPLIHYVAPTVYAYAPGRAAKMARYLDHLLLLFPFEKPYFDVVDLPSTYVGPNILEDPTLKGDAMRFRRQHNIPAERKILCLVPGSRKIEIQNMLPVFDETVARLAARIPGLQVVVPTVPTTADRVRAAAEKWPGPAILVGDEQDKRDAMAASDVALTKSGSVSLEPAAEQVPTVVGGRVFVLSLIQALRGLSLKYISLPNWILDRMSVPEFRQLGCKPGPMADMLERFLTDPDACARQRADQREIMRVLQFDQRKPSERAADKVLELLTKASRIPSD